MIAYFNDPFNLKYRDTRPTLEVELHDPAPVGSTSLGPVHDLTNSTAWKLHIWIAVGKTYPTRLVRNMSIFGAPTLGLLRYTWLASDWGVASSPDPDGSFTVGGLVLCPTPAVGSLLHRMEYEVLSGVSRLTFPNESYDRLRVLADVGQG